MKLKPILINALIGTAIVLCVLLATVYGAEFKIPLVHVPNPPKQAYEYSLYRTGPYEVAKVLGRSAGCQDATPDFIEMVSITSLKSGLDPRIAAATISVESSCNPYAVSTKGAVGIMQIVPSVWKSEFDFQNDVNLLNPRENIAVGTKILARLINDCGVEEGIHRYNGLGVGGDPSYVSKILILSGRK